MITIKNYEKHQHYKNRKPPWIKLYRDLLDDRKFARLSDFAARLLFLLWLLASESEKPGIVDLDSKALAWRLRYTDDTIEAISAAIKELYLQDFIELDSAMLAECVQDAIPEREREEDLEVEKPPSSSSDEAHYLTKKKKRLEGKHLETFTTFWKAFDYKRGKAEAADAWLDIPELCTTLCKRINEAAIMEAKRRAATVADGSTPKMAQGWITGRRWEDEPVQTEKKLTGAALTMRQAMEMENDESGSDSDLCRIASPLSKLDF